MAAAYVSGSRGDANGAEVTTLAVVPGVLTSGGTSQGTSLANALVAFFSAYEAADDPVDLTSATATGATFTEFETLTMPGFTQWQTSGFLAQGISPQDPHTVTGTASSASFMNAAIIEVSGASATVANNGDTSASGTSTNPTGGPLTPSANGLHVFFVIHADNAAFTAGSGWTEALNTGPDGSSRMGIYYRTAVNGVEQTPTVTHAVSAAWSIIHIVLADAGGGGGGETPSTGARFRNLRVRVI